MLGIARRPWAWLTLFLLAIVTVPAMALQDASELTTVGQVLFAVVPLILGFFAMTIYDGVKHVIEKWMALPSAVHAIAGPGLAFLFGMLFGFLGIQPPPSLEAVDSPFVTGVLTALANQGIFRLFRKKAAA